MIGCVNNYGHVLFLQYHGKYTENQDDKYTMVVHLYPHARHVCNMCIILPEKNIQTSSKCQAAKHGAA